MSNQAKRHLLRLLQELHPEWSELVCLHHLAKLTALAHPNGSAQ